MTSREEEETQKRRLAVSWLDFFVMKSASGAEYSAKQWLSTVKIQHPLEKALLFTIKQFNIQTDVKTTPSHCK